MQIYCTSGNLLENINHYNALYYDGRSAVWAEPQPQTVTLGEIWKSQPQVLKVTFTYFSLIYWSGIDHLSVIPFSTSVSIF